LIGEGGFGNVYIAEKINVNENFNNESECFAMKQFDLNKPKNFDLVNILKEINAFGHCQHPNIVKYINHYYDERIECVCLILELCEYGSLSRFLSLFQDKYPNKHIPEEVIYLHII
jgi:serine/threonine protein kinase